MEIFCKKKKCSEHKKYEKALKKVKSWTKMISATHHWVIERHRLRPEALVKQTKSTVSYTKFFFSNNENQRNQRKLTEGCQRSEGADNYLT